MSRAQMLVRIGLFVRDELSHESPLSISELHRRYVAAFKNAYSSQRRRHNKPGNYHSFNAKFWVAQKLGLVEFVDTVPVAGSDTHPMSQALIDKLKATGIFSDQRRFRLTTEGQSSLAWLDLGGALMGKPVGMVTVREREEEVEAPEAPIAPIAKPKPAPPIIKMRKPRPAPKPKPIPVEPTPMPPQPEIVSTLTFNQRRTLAHWNARLDSIMSAIEDVERVPSFDRLKQLWIQMQALLDIFDDVSETKTLSLALKPYLERIMQQMGDAIPFITGLLEMKPGVGTPAYKAAFAQLKKCCTHVEP